MNFFVVTRTTSINDTIIDVFASAPRYTIFRNNTPLVALFLCNKCLAVSLCRQVVCLYEWRQGLHLSLFYTALVDCLNCLSVLTDSFLCMMHLLHQVVPRPADPFVSPYWLV